jgi:hypothetical protein
VVIAHLDIIGFVISLKLSYSVVLSSVECILHYLARVAKYFNKWAYVVSSEKILVYMGIVSFFLLF